MCVCVCSSYVVEFMVVYPEGHCGIQAPSWMTYSEQRDSLSWFNFLICLHWLWSSWTKKYTCTHSLYSNTQIPVCVLFTLPPLRVPIITNLAEGEADASPAPEDEEAWGTFLHAGMTVQEVPASHTAAGVPWLRTASQALVVAALTLKGTRTVLAVFRAH